jgi:hypothetical protein
MDLRFISTLTPDDEDRYAPMILAAIKALLDLTPITYSVRITTANSSVFHHTKTDPDVAGHSAAPVDRLGTYPTSRFSVS